MSNKVIEATWFSGPELFGIVVMENGVGERKAYIGTASGIDPDVDAQIIMEHGFPVYQSHLEKILRALRKD